MISLILLTIVLMAVSFRDFVSRQIEIYYFLLMAIAVIVFCIMRTDTRTMLQNMLVNIVQLVLLIVCLTGYYRLKNGKAAGTFFNTKLGIGDLLFWIITTPLFAPLNFIIWMVVSLLFSLIVHGCVLVLSRKKPSTVPLAGLQAVILIIVLTLDQFVFFFDLLENPLFSPVLN